MQFGEFSKASVRKLRDPMPNAKNISNESCFSQNEIQRVFSRDMQIPVRQTRFIADLENKMIVYRLAVMDFFD